MDGRELQVIESFHRLWWSPSSPSSLEKNHLSFLSLLKILANCEKGIAYMLKDVSQIKICGGYEVFAVGCITFKPFGKDKTMFQVNNSALA